MALTNRYGLVEYDVPGPVCVHERWILDHVVDDYYIIVTPDEDVYCEQMSVTNQDFRAFRIRPAPGAIPAGGTAAQIYALPAWDAATIARLRGEANTEAANERAARGLPGAGGAVVPHAPGPELVLRRRRQWLE